LLIVTLLLNIQVIRHQGVNFQQRIIKLPLYLKMLDFFDRHYNYKYLVKSILADVKTEQERVIKLFEWTYGNLKKVPDGFPIVDDHIWYTIVRGYGVTDQFSDVFTTLCNYAGVDAFFDWVTAKNSDHRIVLSFVKIDGRWNVFDPYNGVYFKNKKNALADIQDIKSGNWILEKIGNYISAGINYDVYFKNIPDIKELGLTRANVQSPINRLRFEIMKLLR
jgi:hypothetical protein